MSGVMCHLFFSFSSYFLFDKVVELVGGGSVINRATLSSWKILSILILNGKLLSECTSIVADPGKVRNCSKNIAVD